MHPVPRLLMLAALLGGCDSPTHPGSLGNGATHPELLKQREHVVVRQPVSAVIEDACNGELVTLTGEELHVFNGVEPFNEDNFSTRFEDLFRASGTGVGESGTGYVFTSTDHFIFTSPDPSAPQFTFTAKGRFEVVSRGGGPNFIEHATFHITLTPDGPPKVTTEFDRPECRG